MNSKNIESPLLCGILFVAGSVSLILGLTVMVGWIIESRYLIQIPPNITYIPFNSALIFFLFGLAYILQSFKFTVLPSLCFVIILIISLLSLAQFLFDVDLGIDFLFITPFFELDNVHRARIAINALVCFILIASTGLLMRAPILSWLKINTSGVLLSIAVAISLVAIIGYAIDLETAYDWKLLKPMALFASLALLILGITGLIDLSFLAKKELKTFYLPTIYFSTASLIMTISIWQALKVQENHFYKQSTNALFELADNQADYAKYEINQWFEQSKRSFSRMSNRLKLFDQITQEEWQMDAKAYLKDDPATVAFFYFNDDQQIEWKEVKESNSIAHSKVKKFLSKQTSPSEQHPKLDLFVLENKTWAIIWEKTVLPSGGENYLAEVFDIRLMFKEIFEPISFEESKVILVDQNNRIEFAKNADDIKEIPFKTDFKIEDTSWQLYIWPYRAALEYKHSILSFIFLIIGSIMTLLVFGTSYFFQITSLQKRELEKNIEQLRTAKIEAERANDIKSQFLANMSHEIRTPLHGILGFTALTLKTPLTTKQKEFLDRIQVLSKRLNELVNNIFDFSRIESRELVLEKTSVNLNYILKEIGDRFISQAEEKNLQLLTRFDPHSPSCVIADSFRLKQILNNLISNALKFTEKGYVFVNIQAKDPHQENKVYRIEVEDTGIGIPTKDQNKLFQKFTQVDESMSRRSEGAGLGLAITKELIDFMGGKIGFESQENKGSLFWCEIPVATRPEDNKIESQLNALLSGKSCLIVDGSDHHAQILNEYLKSWKMETRITQSIEEASKYLNNTSFDVVLINSDLSEISQLKLTSQKVIFLTSVLDQKPFAKHYLWRVLNKPIASFELKATIVDLLNVRT